MYYQRYHRRERYPWWVTLFGPLFLFLGAFVLGNILLYIAIWIISVQ